MEFSSRKGYKSKRILSLPKSHQKCCLDLDATESCKGIQRNVARSKCNQVKGRQRDKSRDTAEEQATRMVCADGSVKSHGCENDINQKRQESSAESGASHILFRAC